MQRCREKPLLVTVPGKGGSEEAHWQTWLEAQYGDSLRIHQDDWDHPLLERWAIRIVESVVTQRRPLVFAAHSFGCLALADALRQLREDAVNAEGPDVCGALFVAPASPSRFGVAMERLQAGVGCRSILVGSENDPWIPFPEYRALSDGWGSQIVNLGAAGHINTAAGFGPWPYGRSLLETLL